jgi:SAM-dependent methyltransferase
MVAGDALALPFADGSFDAATIAFGLRNVADVDAALRELARVTRPGGRLVVCEFSRPTWAPWRTVYTEYLMRGVAGGGPPGVQQPGRVRLPRRVDPGLAGPAARPGASRPPAGSGCSGATWPAASSPCTEPYGRRAGLGGRRDHGPGGVRPRPPGD